MQSRTFRDFTKSSRKEKDSKENGKTLNYYHKEKYREMILNAAETVLKFLGFDRAVYGADHKNNRKKMMKWYDELQEERTKDIQSEMMMEKQ